MLAKLKLWYASAGLYVLGGLLALVVASSLGWYITGLKLDTARSDLNAKGIELSVSNSSVTSLKTELATVNKILQDKSRIEKEKQDGISEALKNQDRADKPLIDLENKLKTRPSTLHCTIPKDLQEAWNAIH